MATQTRSERMLALVDTAIEVHITGQQVVREGVRYFQGKTLDELRSLQREYEMAVAREKGTTVQQVVMRRRVYTPRIGREPWTG